jgi:predicted transport protein
MAIFKNSTNKLNRIKQLSFKLEKEIQDLTEKNLSDIFGLQIVKSEFSLNGLRIDTLAYDNENNSFVIIEYKRDKNFSVIDQGYAYLSLMLNNKADFILEYNENCDKNLKRENVDWSQSRVLFVSPAFSKYQQQAINFKDLPIELWEISKYENDLIQYTRLRSHENSESINKISKKSDVVEKVSSEVKVYTEEDHLSHCSEEIKSLYDELKKQILSIDENIEVIPKKKYIAFKADRNFIDILPQRSKIKFWLNLSKGQLKDIDSIARDVSNVGHWGNGDYEVSFSNSEELPVLLSLIKQSYEKNK